METYKAISADKIEKTTSEIIDLKPLRDEVKEIDKRIKELEKEPDSFTIVTANDSKTSELNSLNERKKEINNILNKV